jgi:CheY-like chemotaxis protein
MDSILMSENKQASDSMLTVNMPVSGDARHPVLAHIKVLLAEDNLINQEVAMTILRKNGVDVQAVKNGREAVTLLETTSFDLVLMDMQMPEMDGLQATRFIRDSTTPVLDHQIPIIAMTANAMRKDQEMCMQAGMNDYISKPFNTAQLIERIIYWKNRDHTELPVRITPVPDVAPVKDDPTPGDEGISPAIQLEELYHRLMDDRGLALSLLQKMDARLDKDLDEVKQSVADHDAELTKSLVHKMKGSAGNLSAGPLFSSLKALEEAVTAGDWEHIREKFALVMTDAGEYRAAVAGLK